MSEENDIDVSKMKPTIVIGMGGTGIKTITRLKKLVRERVPEILKQNKLICLGLDTESWSEAKHHELAPHREYIELAVGVDIDDWVKMEFRDYLEKKSDVGIAPHWPVIDGMCYDPALGAKITNGAAQNRPVGRACVFNSATALIDRLKQIMQDFFDITRAGAMAGGRDPTVHFIGSIAGGTGSSMVFDVPYITRIICDKMGQGKYKSFGHFPLANAFLNDLPGPWEKTRCRANTWTVLKELDEWNRRFIHDPATPHWKVNYGFDCGTLQDGEATDVARQRPLEVTFLYHNRNTGGHLIRNAAPLYEIIAQAIGYIVMSDLTQELDSNLVNVNNQIRDLNSNGKVKAYSALGVATLDLPVERLKIYMGYKWAKQLAMDKCMADVHAPEEEYDKKKWEEFGGLLEKVFTLQFPVYREVDGKWEEGESGILRAQWGELADVYGLEKFGLDVDPKIAAKIADNYDNRISRAKNYRRDCESAEIAHEKRQESRAKDKLDEIKRGIKEHMTSVMDGDRSTDALLFATPRVVAAIKKVDQFLSEEQEQIQGNEARLVTATSVDVKLQDKPFFSSSREKQVKSWSKDNDEYWILKSESDRIVTLRAGLKVVSDFLGEMRLLVHEADKEAELFAINCDSEAEDNAQEAGSDENAKVTCEYLVEASGYEKFIEQFNYKDSSEGIFRAINNRVREEMDISLAEALGAETKGKRDKAKKIWYEECAEAASNQLAKYKLGDHIAKITEEDGNNKWLKGQLKALVERAGPWMEHNEAKIGGKKQDHLTVYQYLIYPEGAEMVKETFEKMEEEGVFSAVVKTGGNKKTHYKKANFGQSVVRISMVHCYSLEILDFLTSERAADLEMVQDEERYASGTLRTIFMENIKDPYPDPLARREKGSEIVLPPNMHELYLTWFMLAHIFGVIKLDFDPVLSKNKWLIDHTQGELDGSTTDAEDVLPPKNKRIRMNEPEKSKLDSQEYALCADIWATSRERDDAAVKLGCFIAETLSYNEAVKRARLKIWEEKGPEGYRQMLLDYEKEGMNKLDDNDQRFLRRIVTKQVNDIAV